MELNPDNFPSAPEKPDVSAYRPLMLIPVLFLLYGLVKMTSALWTASAIKAFSEQGLFSEFLTGVILTGLASGVLIFIRHLKNKEFRLYEYAQAYPMQPWKWRDRWQNNVITCDTKKSLLGLGFAAVVGNFIGWSAMFGMVPPIVRGESEASHWVFVLPIILIVILFTLLFFAFLIDLKHWLMHGKATLTLEEMPARIGEPIHGTFRGMNNVDGVTTMDVTLKCEHHQKSNKNIVKHILYENSFVHTGDNTTSEGDLMIPLIIQMPDEFSLPTSNWQLESNKIIWTVTIQPAVEPGAHSMEFEIPVFP